MKRKKLCGVAMFVILALLGLATMVSADSDLYEITKIKVDGVTVYEVDEDGDTDVLEVGLELDEAVDVDVTIVGTGDSSSCPDGDTDDCEIDVKVKAWIGGYEHGDIEDVSSTFDIEPNVTYTESVTLDIPDDMDVEDDNDYTLYVEVYDDEDDDRVDLDVFIERPRHSVKVLDVIYDDTVEAGDTMHVEVRLENLGEEKEEDLKVELEVDGKTTADYVDELASFEEDNEDEESSDSVDLSLTLDDDMAAGDYDLTVTVTYNRNHDTVEEIYSLTVESDEEEVEEEEEEVVEEADVTVSLSSTALEGSSETGTEFVLTFVNAGDESAVYSVEVAGETQWATSDVSPSAVVVSGSETEEVVVTVTPDSEADGTYDYTVQILDDNGELVEEIEMSMTVGDVNSQSAWEDTGSALKLGFIILIVLIIIIALIVAFRKLGDDDDDDLLEPKEGKTYY